MQLVVASTPDSTVDLVTFDFWAQVLHFGSCIISFFFCYYLFGCRENLPMFYYNHINLYKKKKKIVMCRVSSQK